MLRLALAQYALSSDLHTNLTQAIDLMARAAENGADFILFPELCVSPFFPQYAAQRVEHFATSLEDAVVRKFREACRNLNIAASPNVYFREGDRRFDASVLIDRHGCIQGISKMVHIAQVPGFYEQDYYTPSDTGFRVYDTALGKIGIVVCFDRHYPESTRTCVLRGASLVLIPTANTLDEPRDVFDCELRAAAFQNGVFIAMCNRVGSEGEAVFCGESIVVGPTGNVVVKAGTSEELLIGDIDLAEVPAAREKRPYLSLRRPEMYA
jgi:predicted amidohydrolase